MTCPSVGGDATALLQEIVDGCAALRVADGNGAFAVLRPTIEQWLKEGGVPMDLSSVGRRGPMTMREVVSLPLRVAREHRRRVLLFFDEIQRAVDYTDGHDVLTDIRDIYSGAREHTVVLVDGSEERSIKRLLDDPYNIAKLVSRYELPTTIAAYLWEEPLVERFAAIGKALADDQRDAIIAFGAARPYSTMTAARNVALAAVGHDDPAVSQFDLNLGLDQARQDLRDDYV